MSADLHCHTVYSDGSDSVDFVIQLGKNVGLSAMAITDHDNYSGSHNAAALGEKYGITVINGVECSCGDKFRGHKVHILCYNCKYPEAIRELLQKATRQRDIAVRQMIRNVSRLYPITEEMVMDGLGPTGFCGKQHIMLALMKAGYTDEIFGSLFQQLFNEKFGSCFVPIEYTDIHEAMNYLLQSGGVIVMAHPSVYGSIASLEDLIKAGIHGIELNHPRNKSEHRPIIEQAAKEYGLLVTGGTDFHGCYAEKKSIHPLGSFTVSDEQFARLLEKSAQLWSVN